MMRYANNVPTAQSITSPHLYHRTRPSSSLHRPSSSPFNTLYARYSSRTYWLSLTNLLRLLWLLLIFWGERYIWTSSISACSWESWERWPADAIPHRVTLVADPQLVDIHTYSRRGVSLAATIFYTDKYLSRAWSLLHSELIPAETYFLGDLFDGGREWVSVEDPVVQKDPNAKKDWKWHGDEYWMSELARWEKIFPPPAGVRVKTGLPGNHDLGFGEGVKLAVRERFKAFFGKGNERWEAGNHTWVMVDGVSLSNDQDEAVFGPTREFLEDLERPMTRGKLTHDPKLATQRKMEQQKRQPTVLLTHVPLFREKETDCGPLREKGKSIPIWQGYQYQNVLTPELSAELLKRTGARYVFSGDDHDACEVEHMYGPLGKVREWTVKSVSWTMGVRRPGFEMVSLWNPSHPSSSSPPPPPSSSFSPAKIEETPEELTARLGPAEERNSEHLAPQPPVVHGGQETLQAHLCFLPDQIHIFLVYAVCAVVTLLVVCVDVWRRPGETVGNGGVLPSWKGIPDAEGKYWKPNKRTQGGRWFVRRWAEEICRIAGVVVGFYGVLLWMW